MNHEPYTHAYTGSYKLGMENNQIGKSIGKTTIKPKLTTIKPEQ